ncbi:aldehyde dehydrogenase family protein [Mesorhizobium sp. SEMIA 3007]|uniref:aldehyde dehydrogenase family protein n=1 Tax=Mesorhizobium sp. SEMIA 3007 TaxID=1862350 RepID=UPI001FD92842|nr:aldehyde dehydrogenase family protein [Mesorhizobium sp. SEMIA 3007]
MAVAQEETFGRWRRSSASTMRMRLSMANDGIYGLAAYFYASNLKRVWRVAEALEHSMGWHQHGAVCLRKRRPLAA